MEEKEYTQTICGILGSVIPILEQARKCIFAEDRNCLDRANTILKETLKSYLPLSDEVTRKKEKSTAEIKFLTILPTIQKLGIDMGDLLRASTTKLDSGVPFTDKGLNEIKAVITGAQDLAKDTRDVFITKNCHLGQRVQSDVDRLHEMVDAFSVEHEDRLIKGFCSTKASYLYLDMMGALKRTIRQLAALSREGL